MAATSTLTASHRVATWNTLCALIDQCVDSTINVVASIIWSHDVWNRAFDLYVSQSCNARPKSSKQLLQTLATALRKKIGPANSDQTVAARLIEGVCNARDHDRTRACLQALTHFLGKEVLGLDDVLSPFRLVFPGNTPGSVEELLSILFSCIGRADFGSVVGQAISVVLDKASGEKTLSNDRSVLDSTSQPLWANPLDDTIRSKRATLDDLRIHLFPTIFKRSLSDYVSFLARHGLDQSISPTSKISSSSADCTNVLDDVLYAALQTGKELGLVRETMDSEMTQTSSMLFIPVRSIVRLFRQNSRSARLTGLSLLITSYAVTRPFPTRSFKLLRHHLSHFFADTDANFRSELFSLTQKLIDRLRAITAVLARQSTSRVTCVDTAVDTATTFYEHKDFLEWLLRFLEWELRPTASYQRHISGLKTLSIVARSGVDDRVSTEYLSKSALAETKWPFHLLVVTPGLHRLLLDLLTNPFDDVRQTAASILSLYPASTSAAVEISKAIERAEDTMLATGRADQANGVAHMYALLYRRYDDEPVVSGPSCSPREAVVVHLVESLEQMLKVAKCTAAKKYPIHGLLTSLRYILARDYGSLSVKHLLERLIACLHAVWETAKPVLCNDAPEGYLPEENDVEASSKDTLSYSWRALKESSLLLGVVISHCSLQPDDMTSLSNLCFTQLAELRHRGAFSTVAQTWITCCSRCGTLKSQDGWNMLQLWYSQVLGILNGRTTINTRRSAGLPSLLCGILIADRSGHMISQAFNELSVIALQPIDTASTQESSLPQVHAMNCLKDILKSTRLGEQSERLVPDSLRLAAESLRSGAWAIRNCGLMLFRAVIDRLLGTNDAYLDNEAPSQRQFDAQNHSELFDLVLNLLTIPDSEAHGATPANSEGVFPALHLLQRTQIPEERRPYAEAAVLALTASRSWHVRDKAARAYAAMVSRSQADAQINLLLDVRTSDQNTLHGALLCVRYSLTNLAMLRGIPKSGNVNGNGSNQLHLADGFYGLHPTMLSHCARLYHENICPVTKAAYADVLTDSLSLSHRTAQSNGHRRIMAALPGAVSCSFNVAQELRCTVTTKSFHGHDVGVLRRALAQLFVRELYTTTEMLEEQRDDALALIVSLGRVDADACSSIFGTARSFGEVEESLVRPQKPTINVLLRAAFEIFSSDHDLGLKCEVQRFLLDLADQNILSGESILDFQAFMRACCCAPPPISTQCNQHYADHWLQLQAVYMEHLLSIGKYEDVTPRIPNFVQACTSAIHGEGFQSLEAAALAISRLTTFWAYVSEAGLDALCDLVLAVYDLLNDDDEDIRILAARTSSRILEANSHRLGSTNIEPIEASQELVAFMIRRWPTESHFSRQAFLRAFNIAESLHQSVLEQLKMSTTIDTALFGEEKQNLYIDEAREVKLWSQVILGLQAHSTSRKLVKQLTYWVSDGLEALSSKVKSEPDGAFGWTTKPDVFTLGLQVIYAAEVLLNFVEHGVRLPVKPSTLRFTLVELTAAAASGNVNNLWMHELERVLFMAITRKLGHCSDLLDMIAMGPGA